MSAPSLVDALLQTAGKMHPLIVHLPIGLVVTAALVEAWRGIQRVRGMSPFTPVALWMGALFAAAASGTGWLFAQNDTETDELFWHRWLGISVAVLLIPLAWMATRATRAGDVGGAQLAPLARGLVVGVAILAGWVGHLGGSMVWGGDFVIRPLLAWERGSAGKAEAQPDGAPIADDNGPTRDQGAGIGNSSTGNASNGVTASAQEIARAAFFNSDVLPILKARCYECHGDGNSKGHLAMDDLAQLVGQNRDDDWIVHPGDPAGSELFKRIQMPRELEGTMPPEGERLTAAQIDAIRKWIVDGAVTSAAASQPAVARSARPVGSAPAPSGVTTPPQGAAPEPTARQQSAIKSLRERGVVVQPLSLREGWLEVNASSRAQGFADAQLATVVELAALIAELNLARTGVTDQGMKTLPRMPELLTVRLDGTQVGDMGLEVLLRNAPNLQALNLVGTSVSDSTAKRIAALPKLARVYLWRTAVTPEGIAAIKQAHPGALVDAGAP